MTSPGKQVFSVIVVALLLCCGLPSAALAQLSCDVTEAAGKPVPVSRPTADSGSFRIFWQISTQIEDLADAERNSLAMADIDEAREIVDGYYINALLGGPLIYWPTRPQQCRLNFKRITEGDSIEVDGQTFTFEDGAEAGRNQCLAQQKEFLRKESDDGSAASVQVSALQRVFRNLRLAEEQKAGKSIWGVSIIRSTDFIYDKKEDKVVMKELPNTYCVMNAAGITLNGLMIYQEPRVQQKTDVFVWIPRKNRRGELVYSSTPRRDKIPENARAFDLIAKSFAAAGVPVGHFRANIRMWNDRRSPRLVKELDAIDQFGGFNFEGGTRMLADEKKTPDHLIKGLTYILQNTNRDVSMLMPGYWDRDMVGTDAEVDTQIPRLRQLLLTLNAGLNASLKLDKGQNALCSSRLAFIVGSYGRPVHVKPLPMRRANGELAGTVTGQIKLLSEVRKELCG